MVDARDHDVRRTLQRGAGGAHAGRHAALADPQPVGLRELVVVVGTDRQPLHRPRDFVAVRVLRLLVLGPRRNIRNCKLVLRFQFCP